MNHRRIIDFRIPARSAVLALGAVVSAGVLGTFVNPSAAQASTPPSATLFASAQSNFMGAATSETNGNTFFGGNRGDGVLDGLWGVTPSGTATRLISASIAGDLCKKVGVAANQSGIVVLTWHNGKVFFGCSSLGRVWSIPDTTVSPLASAAGATLEFELNPATCANATAGGSYNPEGSIYGGAIDSSGNLWFSDNFNSSQLYVHRVGAAAGSCDVVSTNPWKGVNAMRFGEDGRLYYSYDYGSSIYRIDPANSNAYEVYSATDIATCPNGYEGFALPRGLQHTILASCTDTSGGITVIPQNPDGSAGTPTVVFGWTAGSQRGMYAFDGICDGRYYMANFGASGTALPGEIWGIAPIVEGMCVPQNPSATPGGGSARVSWTAVPPYNVESYTVTASSGETCTVNAPATACTVRGLDVGVPVTFTVVAKYPAGTSNDSVATTAVTPTAELPPTGSNQSALAGAAMSILAGGCFLLGLARRRARSVA